MSDVDLTNPMPLPASPRDRRAATAGPPALATAAPPVVPKPARPRQQRMVGSYQIVRLLGQGGMGAVYEARQANPSRTVALKVIKPGLLSPNLLRRFTFEAEVLGRLEHAGIARIYEAGMAKTAAGPQPYFAMELVRGPTLTAYAVDRKLDTRHRLEILAGVCDAVHDAHRRGVIHRDLKPANVLVTEDGQPKVLDFGIAKATDSDSAATLQTSAGQIIGTLAYMSPE